MESKKNDFLNYVQQIEKKNKLEKELDKYKSRKAQYEYALDALDGIIESVDNETIQESCAKLYNELDENDAALDLLIACKAKAVAEAELEIAKARIKLR